jgi:hypothetical protein
MWDNMRESRIKSVVGGTISRSPDGVDIIIPQTSFLGRAYVVNGNTPANLSGGQKCTLTSITYDHDATKQANMILATVASDVVTFTKPGRYLLAYHATHELDLGGAEGHVPGVVKVETEVKVGGTAITGIVGAFSAVQIPNLSGFVTNEGAIVQSVDLCGVTVTSEELSSTEDGAVAWQQYINSTIDCPQAVDVTTSLNVIADYTPSGTVSGMTSGTALIETKLNSSGVLKLFVGLTEYAPTVQIFGTSTGGTVINVNTSLSITRLS